MVWISIQYIILIVLSCLVYPMVAGAVLLANADYRDCNGDSRNPKILVDNYTRYLVSGDKKKVLMVLRTGAIATLWPLAIVYWLLYIPFWPTKQFIYLWFVASKVVTKEAYQTISDKVIKSTPSTGGELSISKDGGGLSLTE